MNKPLSSLRLALLAAAFAALSAVPAAAQNQDASKALNSLFQSLVRPNQPAQAAPQKPSNANTAAGALGAVLGGGAAPGAAGGGDLMQLLSQSLNNIDTPKEIEIGRQLAAVLLGSKPLHPDMALQRYVNQLGRWISLQSARPELPWTFAVLDDAGFNAFAAPGGYVFVTKGLVDRVGDEAELAGILAHEISHVTGKHHLKAIRKTAQTGLVTQALASQLRNNVGGVLSAQLLALGRDIYSKGLDQDDEFEADRIGVALAARAGFDPYGLVAVLQQLRTATPDNAMFTLTLSTHPPAQLRLDQIEQAMGNRLDGLAGLPSTPVQQRVSAAGGGTPGALPLPAPAARNQRRTN